MCFYKVKIEEIKTKKYSFENWFSFFVPQIEGYSNAFLFTLNKKQSTDLAILALFLL